MLLRVTAGLAVHDRCAFSGALELFPVRRTHLIDKDMQQKRTRRTRVLGLRDQQHDHS